MDKGLQGLRELGQFLGAKIDTLASAKQTVHVDISETASKLEQATAAIILAATNLGKTVQAIEKNNTSVTGMRDGVGEASERLSRSVDAITDASRKIEELSQREDVKSIQGELQRLASVVTTLATGLKNVKPADMSGVLDGLKRLEGAVRAIDVQVPQPEKIDYAPLKAVADQVEMLRADIAKNAGKDRTDEVIKAIREIKLEQPKELKLEKNQLAQLVHGASGGLGGVAGSELKPNKATVGNVSLTTADTEYSYTFPAGTTGFRIKLRGQGTLLYYAWATGKVPGSGDGTAYSTVQQNHELVREHLDIGGKTIYLETAENTHVAEIESYQVT